MAESIPFELWLELEHAEPRPGDDPTDDFVNVQVLLPHGREYALNVWTFGFMRRARFPWPYDEGVGEVAEYLLPPDLFVTQLDRPTIERVVGTMLAKGEMKDEWRCRAQVDDE